MKPLNLIVVAHHFYPRQGGVAHATTQFVKAIDRHAPAINCSVIAMERLAGEPELRLQRGRVVRIHPARYLPYMVSIFFYELLVFRQLLRFAAARLPDIILFETMERSICLLCAVHVRRLRDRIAVRIHGCTETEYYVWSSSLQHRVRSTCARWAARRIHLVFATTEHYLCFFKDYFLRANELTRSTRSFAVVPNVVLAHEEAANFAECAPLLDLIPDRFLLSLGRLDADGMAQKGFGDILAALRYAIMEGSGLPPGWKVVLIGDGNQRCAVQQCITDLEIESIVTVLPFLPHAQIRALQRQAAAVILVSRFEGQAMFALESLYAGAPLILSDCGGLAGLVNNGENGYIVVRQDWRDLSRALLRVCALTPEQRAEMRRASVAIFAQRFAPEATIRHFAHCVRIHSEMSALRRTNPY